MLPAQSWNLCNTNVKKRFTRTHILLVVLRVSQWSLNKSSICHIKVTSLFRKRDIKVYPTARILPIAIPCWELSDSPYWEAHPRGSFINRECFLSWNVHLIRSKQINPSLKHCSFLFNKIYVSSFHQLLFLSIIALHFWFWLHQYCKPEMDSQM